MLFGRQNLLARRLLCSKFPYRLLVSKKLRRNPSLNVFGWGKPYGHPNFAMEKTILELDDEQFACVVLGAIFDAYV